MKNLLSFFLIASMACLSIISKASGSVDFKSVINSAKAENKYILVVYGRYNPESSKENDPFADKTSEGFYRENYIVTHYDRSSKEGKDFGIIFNVGTYPSLYFFNAGGKLLYMDAGAKTPVELVKLGSSVITLNAQKKQSDYSVDAPFNKLQRKWYTSKALGFYAGESIVATKDSEKLSVTLTNNKSSEEVESMIFEGLKLTPFNYYLYYLNSLLAYKNQEWDRAGRNISAFLSAVKADEIPVDISENTKLMLKTIKSNQARESD